jgi:hypothetical protein
MPEQIPVDGDSDDLEPEIRERLAGPAAATAWFGDHEVVVHVDDIPDSDVTMVRGIPCTTALRTVIDVAPDVDLSHLQEIVQDCLDRRLFTIEEAWTRLGERDMRTCAGADLLRLVLPG